MDGIISGTDQRSIVIVDDIPDNLRVLSDISALDDTMDKINAFAVGGVDYISKPFESKEVIARVRTQIALRQTKLKQERKNTEIEAARRHWKKP